MPKFKPNTFILLLALTGIMSLTIALAESPRIYLSAEGVELTAGQEFTLDVLVENIPPIYGADVRLLFSPDEVEVVTLSDGDFINAENSFFLQNEFNNEEGSIDYALALVNPAPEAQGNGRLLTVTFLAKRDGASAVGIESSEFGTRTGDLVTLIKDGVEVVIDSAEQLVIDSAERADGSSERADGSPERADGTEGNSADGSTEPAIDPMILIIGGVLGGVALMLLIQLGFRGLRRD
jgi:hypothetical protein